MPPIEDLIKETGNRSYQQYKNIRNWVRGTWAYMVIATAVIAISLLILSNALEKATSVLERRSPVLEYMYCIDNHQAVINRSNANRDRAQTNYLIALVNAGSAPSPEQVEEIARLENLYLVAEDKLVEASSTSYSKCPDAPN